MSTHVREMRGPISKSKEAVPSATGSRADHDLNLMEHLGQLFDVTQDLLCVLGFDDGIRYLNNSWESVLGYTQQEVKMSPPDALVHPDDRVATRADIEKVRAGIPTKSFENRLVCKDGSYKWFSWSVAASSAQQCFYIAGRDVTENKRSEEHVLRLAQALENSNEMICMGDSTGRAVFANQALLEASGFREEEILGKAFHETLLSVDNPATLADEIRASIIGEGKWSGECLQRCKEGPDLSVFLSIGMMKDRHGRVTGSYGISQDITARKRIEQQLRQAQKMEAVGQLAGGIAHDFSNLLMVILGYAGLVIESVDAGGDLQRKVKEISKAANRAASLTRQLLAFSRQQVLEARVLNMNDVVEDIRKMLGRLINEDIALTIDLDPELGRMKADQGQIEQVIVNLAVNARDAMPKGGTLTIKTANVELSESSARRHEPMPPGSYIGLTVSDTGTGMDAKTRSHVFEPFFTTKERGKGTGLGLATVYGVVKQSGGFIWLTSELGQGATFEILFPRVSEPVEGNAKDADQILPARGSETILLVEDDEALRELILSSLTEAGYTVLEAGDGLEALRIARGKAGRIDLVLSDVVMPDMSGTEMAEEIGALYPNTRILFMSGYSEFGGGHQQILRQGQVLLQKPFDLQNLAQKVREVLKGGSAVASNPTHCPGD
jgi:PAS domain S-box-containing protein